MIEVTRRQNQEPDAEEIKEFDELEKLMAAEETEKKTREKSATDIIHEVAEEMCMHYCKYPEQWDEETQGDLLTVNTARTVLWKGYVKTKGEES